MEWLIILGIIVIVWIIYTFALRIDKRKDYKCQMTRDWLDGKDLD
jgi:hypothetical protein